MAENKNQPMSEPDLRSAVQTQLRASGVADDLKAQLRAKIINHLNNPLPPKNTCSTTTTTTTSDLPYVSDLGACNLVHTIGNVLVADYLTSHQLDYSLSVYLPETAQSVPPNLDITELNELLHLTGGKTNSNAFVLFNEIGNAAAQSTCTSYYQNVNLNQQLIDIDNCCLKAVLEAIIRGIRKFQFSVNVQQVQTDDDTTSKAVREYKELIDQMQTDSKKALMDQARTYDTMFDERLAQELNRQIELFKSTELKRIQVETRESIFNKIEQAKEIAEKRHAENDARLRKEIDQLRAHATKRESEYELQLGTLRSKLNQQVQTAQNVEAAVRTQIESQVHANVVELESTKRQLSELQRRITQLCTERDEARTRVDNAMQTARLEASREQSEFVNKLKIQEAKLEAEHQVLDERRQNLDRFLVEEKELRQELSQTRKLLDQAQTQIIALQKEIRSSSQGHATLNKSKNASESGLAKELKEMSLKLEDAFSRLQSAPPVDQFHSLRLSEQKWQHECQGLISRLEREYRRGDDLERQLMITKNAKSELKTEVMHLRVLLHQLSANRMSTSVNHAPSDIDSTYRFMPDPMISVSSNTPSPTRLGHSRRIKHSSIRDSTSHPRSFASDSDEDEVPITVEVSPTSRESLISDLSSAEMRILRTKPYESGSNADPALVGTDFPTRSRSTNDFDHTRSSGMGNRRNSLREVMIAPVPVIFGQETTAIDRIPTFERFVDSSTPSDLSAPERKILSRRASREGPAGGFFPNYNELGPTAVGLGLDGSNGLSRSNSCSVLTAPFPNPQNDQGVVQPYDFSGSEIKILQRRASRELGSALDTGMGDTGNAARSSPAVHVVRTKSTESVVSDMSGIELRLLSESTGAIHSKAAADSAPHKVYMASKENIVSDMSTVEKKLLVKNGSPSTRASVDDLGPNRPGSMHSVAMTGISSSQGNLSSSSGGGHERKVVILTRDEICDGAQLTASRDSNISGASTRHVAFSTTDEEHEVDVHSVRRVAFGESKELIVESREIDIDSENDHRSRVVSFDELASSSEHLDEYAEEKDDDGLTQPESVPSNLMTAEMNAAMHVSPLDTSIDSSASVPVTKQKAANAWPESLAARAQALTNANPTLLKYIDGIAANQTQLPGLAGKNESEDDSNDFGTGATISAAATNTESSSK